jgi:hypothetical protein
VRLAVLETGGRLGAFPERATQMLIRVGDTIINLDNVMKIDLDYPAKEGEEKEGLSVCFEFIMRGMDELDEGQNITQPYLEILEGKEAEAVRSYLKQQCPDLLRGE